MSAPKISYVVIGRNEARNLPGCLRSLLTQQNQPSFEILYVDSGSTDDSVKIARAVPGVRVLTCDSAQPNAAKARNIGWQASKGELVHFVDGDTTLVPYWVAHALSAMQDPLVGVVCGQLKERHPERSPYNRFADLDWPSGTGPTDTFGGVVLMRRDCLVRCGGFNEALRSGEEPELALRLIRKGYTILQLPVQMAWHDLGVTSFGDYWQRNVAVGWAYAERVAGLHAGGQSLLTERTVKSAAFLLGTGTLLLGAAALSLRLLPVVFLGLALDLVRIASRERERAGSWKHALLYALHVRFLTVPICVGAWRWRKDRKARLQPGSPSRAGAASA